MFFGGIGRFEAKLLGNFCAGWREAVVFQAAFDKGKNFALARRELDHGNSLSVYTGAVIIYSEWRLAILLLSLSEASWCNPQALAGV